MHQSLSETEFIFLDTETTGLNPAFGDRIIEIALLKTKNREKIDSFQTFINPGRPISPGASAINGITDEMVQFAPFFTQVAEQILAFIQDAILVIHNAPFDLGFLSAQFNLAQYSLPVNPVLDSLKLARLLYPDLESHSLGKLATALVPKAFGTEHMHRAMNDVEVTKQIFDIILNDLDTRGFKTVSEILDLQGGSVPFPTVAPKAFGEAKDIPLPEELAEAIKGKKRLTIVYVSSAGQETIRTIEPIEVNAYADYLYLIAFCHMRGEQRTFRLDRVIEMKVESND